MSNEDNGSEFVWKKESHSGKINIWILEQKFQKTFWQNYTYYVVKNL